MQMLQRLFGVSTATQYKSYCHFVGKGGAMAWEMSLFRYIYRRNE